MIVNLTPHPMHIFPMDCPDRIVPGSVEPLWTLPACDGRPARLGETVVSPARFLDADFAAPVVDVVFGTAETLPPPVDGVWFLTSRPVAMASRDRTDLLVPHLPVRDLDGSTLGCRALARPV